MNKKLALAFMAVVVFAFTGCGSSQSTSSNVAVEEKVEGQETTQAQEEAATVTVTHALGTTEVPKNPKNVVVLELGMLDAMDALGIEVKGLPLSGSLPEHLSAYADESKYTNVGSLKELDLEKIFEVEPELIIIGGRQADYYEELNKIAPTLQLAVDASDYMNTFTTNMNYLGEIFGKEAEVAEKLEAIQTSMNEIAALAKEKNVNGLVTLANGDAFSVYGQGSRFGVIHNEFGITPVDTTIEDSTHGQNASFEYVLEKNPDYLFVVDRTAVTEGEGSAPALFDNDLIKQTKAYQNDRIIYLNPNIWYTAGGGFTSTQMMIDEVSAALNK